MQDKIKIALDCMGGDNAPESVIGAIDLIDKDLRDECLFYLYGDQEKINKLLNKYRCVKEVSKVVHTSVYISSEEKPSAGIRKKDSSIRLAVEAIKNGEVDGAISAGNTGALMAISKLVLKTIVGIDRPALVTLMPNLLGQSTALLDMGANIECDSTNLYQFALMGSAFYRAINGVNNPKIGILNVGSEETKGNDAVKNASLLLKNSVLKHNFFGFIEGDDILKGLIDVVVTDGFTGNIALKSIEGASKLFASVVKEGFTSSFLSKIGYILASNSINNAKEKIDHKRYNGAMLVGLNGIVVKSHGNADKLSFSHAIKNTINLIKNKVNDEITCLLQSFDNEKENGFDGDKHNEI